jgi:hypothetical protein
MIKPEADREGLAGDDGGDFGHQLDFEAGLGVGRSQTGKEEKSAQCQVLSAQYSAKPPQRMTEH